MNFSPKIDVWSLGVIIYILLTKEFPFWEQTEFETYTSILKDTLKFPRSIELSIEARHLLSRMLDKDPDRRYSIEDIQIHPWLSESFSHIDIEKKFYEKLEDNFEFYDMNEGNKRLRRGSGVFNTTISKNISSIRDRKRRVSSHPHQIARRISKMSFEINLPIVNESKNQGIVESDDSSKIFENEINLGSDLIVANKEKEVSFNELESIEITGTRNVRNNESKIEINEGNSRKI